MPKWLWRSWAERMKLKLRKVMDGDIAFIASTWIDHIAALKYFRRCPRRVIRENLFDKVKDVVKKSNVVVACFDGDESQIFGYIIFKDEALHFLYTKLLYRKMGIAKTLLKEADAKFDKCSTQSDDIWFTKYARDNRIAFNPWGIS
jgi:hypothetical protein